MDISLQLEDTNFIGTIELGFTLAQFLEQCGVEPVPALLQDADGEIVAPCFMLAYRCDGGRFRAVEAPVLVPALALDDLLSSLSQPTATL